MLPKVLNKRLEAGVWKCPHARRLFFGATRIFWLFMYSLPIDNWGPFKICLNATFASNKRLKTSESVRTQCFQRPRFSRSVRKWRNFHLLWSAPKNDISKLITFWMFLGRYPICEESNHYSVTESKPYHKHHSPTVQVFLLENKYKSSRKSNYWLFNKPIFLL